MEVKPTISVNRMVTFWCRQARVFSNDLAITFVDETDDICDENNEETFKSAAAFFAMRFSAITLGNME